MHFGLLEFTERIFGVVVCHGNILVDLRQFLTLVLRLYGEVLGNVIDVTHNICDVCNIRLSLRDHVLHKVALALDLQGFGVDLGLQLVLIVLILILFLRYTVNHVCALIRVIDGDDAILGIFDGEICVDLLFVLDLLADYAKLFYELILLDQKGLMLVALDLGVLGRYLEVSILFDFAANSFDHGSLLLETLLNALSKIVIVHLGANFVVHILKLLHFCLDIRELDVDCLFLLLKVAREQWISIFFILIVKRCLTFLLLTADCV